MNVFFGCDSLEGIYIPGRTSGTSGWNSKWSYGVSSEKIFWNTAMPK